MAYQENRRYPTEGELKAGAKSLAEKWRKDDEAAAKAPPPKQPQCLRCIHVFPRGKCEAFPNGIPLELAMEKFDHRNPYPGDNGIRFEEGKSPFWGS